MQNVEIFKKAACVKLEYLNTTNSSRNLYSRGFLSLELPRLARSLSEADFTRFQCERLREIIPTFAADSLSVAVLVFDQEGAFQRFSYVGEYRVPAETYKKYHEFKHLDVMIDINRQFRGTAIFNTDYMKLDDWRNDAFYDGFMRPTGKYHAAIVSYPYPFKSELELRFNFQTAHPNTFGAELSKDLVEYANLPFFIAWLYRLNVIDDQLMTAWLSLLIELGPFEVMLLRKLCGARGFSVLDAARTLSTDTARIEGTLFSIAGSSGKSSGFLPDSETSYEWLLNLGKRYDFLKYAGEFVSEQTVLQSISAKYASTLDTSARFA